MPPKTAAIPEAGMTNYVTVIKVAMKELSEIRKANRATDAQIRRRQTSTRKKLGSIRENLRQVEMRHRVPLIVLACATLLSSHSALAQGGGPPGEMIRALAIDPFTPATLYAGTERRGVFKSINGGTSWTAVNFGLPYVAISALAIDPSTPSTLYVGYYVGGVFKSTNGGASWTAINSGLTTTNVYSVAIDPSTPSTLYAGTYEGGVFKSTNGGNSWTAINSGLGNASVEAVVINPSTPTTLHAGLGSFVAKSVNGGISWTWLFLLGGGSSLAIDPSTPETLYTGGNGGVFKSTDGGASWIAVNNGLTNTFVFALAIDPSFPATLYAGTDGGVFKSTNGGTIWTAINSGLTITRVYALAIDPSIPATLYAGNVGGVFKSTNGGSSWTDVNSGLTGTYVQALAIDPSASATLYAGTLYGGVSKSTDGGTSWAAVNSGLTDASVYALAIDPSAPAMLYAGTGSGGVFKTTNGGTSWAAVNSGLTAPLRVFYALAIDPLTPTTLYAGGAGVFKSANGGTSWTAVNSGITAFWVHAVAIDPSTPTTLYAGTDGGGVFKSTNGATSWIAVNSLAGLPYSISSSHIYALAIDPAFPATVYATAADPSGTSTRGIFKSTNKGTIWRPTGSGLTTADVQALAIDPSIPSTLYAGTGTRLGSAFKSTNGATNWTVINSGLTTTYVQTLTIDPSIPATLYAGTYGAGVFKSTNGGASWQPTGAETSMTPGITVQPMSVFRRAGENASFSVTANGQPPLRYQWRKGAGILANATSSSLSLTNVQFATAGGYSVVVTNSFGSVISAFAQLTVYTNLVLTQTNRAPTTNEIGKPTIPTDPTHFKVYTNGNFQSGVALNPNKMTVVITHGWNGTSMYWPGNTAHNIGQRIGASTVNIVAWDWTAEAQSEPTGVGRIAAKTPGQGTALGTNLVAALGVNYAQRIHFIGHSFGTLVNGHAANYVHAHGFSWTNTQMTLCDEAEAAWELNSTGWQMATTLPAKIGQAISSLSTLNGNFSTPQRYWDRPLPEHFAWADNYISAVGLLHPDAANAILTWDYPTTGSEDFGGWVSDWAIFHAFSHNFYEDTIEPGWYQTGGRTNATYMGFICSFEGGGTASRPAANTVFYQNPVGYGYELDLVPTTLAFATNFLNDRFRSVLGTAAETGENYLIWNPLGQAVGQVFGLIDSVGNNVNNLFVNLRTSLLPSGTVRPLGPVPNGNTPAYAWIPLDVPSNVVSMSFDFMLQGNGNQDSFQVALRGTNILSLETSLIQTNVTQNSGLIGISQYAGQHVELFLGVVGGTSTNVSLSVSNFQFYATSQPSLQIQLSGTNVVLTWPLSGAGYVLQSANNLTPPISWTPVTNAPVIVDFQYTVTNQISGGSRFYRLARASTASPALHAQVSGNNFILSWPSSVSGYALETTTNLAATSSWTAVTNTPALANQQYVVTNQISGAARFYRLRK